MELPVNQSNRPQTHQNSCSLTTKVTSTPNLLVSIAEFTSECQKSELLRQIFLAYKVQWLTKCTKFPTVFVAFQADAHSPLLLDQPVLQMVLHVQLNPLIVSFSKSDVVHGEGNARA